jgi:hypothetical protein
MTYAEYLAAEAVAEVRHEFLNGEVCARAGGTPGEPRVEVFRRIEEGGRWELLDARPDETIELATLGVQLDVAAVYA